MRAKKIVLQQPPMEFEDVTPFLGADVMIHTPTRWVHVLYAPHPITSVPCWLVEDTEEVIPDDQVDYWMYCPKLPTPPIPLIWELNVVAPNTLRANDHIFLRRPDGHLLWAQVTRKHSHPEGKRVHCYVNNGSWGFWFTPQGKYEDYVVVHCAKAKDIQFKPEQYVRVLEVLRNSITTAEKNHGSS